MITETVHRESACQGTYREGTQGLKHRVSASNSSTFNTEYGTNVAENHQETVPGDAMTSENRVSEPGCGKDDCNICTKQEEILPALLHEISIKEARSKVRSAEVRQDSIPSLTTGSNPVDTVQCRTSTSRYNTSLPATNINGHGSERSNAAEFTFPSKLPHITGDVDTREVFSQTAALNDSKAGKRYGKYFKRRGGVGTTALVADTLQVRELPGKIRSANHYLSSKRDFTKAEQRKKSR